MRKEETKTYRYFDNKGVEWENELQALVSDFIDLQFSFLSVVCDEDNSLSNPDDKIISEMKKKIVQSMSSKTTNEIKEKFYQMMYGASYMKDFAAKIWCSTCSFDKIGNITKGD